MYNNMSLSSRDLLELGATEAQLKTDASSGATVESASAQTKAAEPKDSSSVFVEGVFASVIVYSCLFGSSLLLCFEVAQVGLLYSGGYNDVVHSLAFSLVNLFCAPSLIMAFGLVNGYAPNVLDIRLMGAISSCAAGCLAAWAYSQIGTVIGVSYAVIGAMVLPYALKNTAEKVFLLIAAQPPSPALSTWFSALRMLIIIMLPIASNFIRYNTPSTESFLSTALLSLCFQIFCASARFDYALNPTIRDIGDLFSAMSTRRLIHAYLPVLIATVASLPVYLYVLVFILPITIPHRITISGLDRSPDFTSGEYISAVCFVVVTLSVVWWTLGRMATYYHWQWLRVFRNLREGDMDRLIAQASARKKL